MSLFSLMFFVVLCVVLVSADVQGFDYVQHTDGHARIMFGTDAQIEDFPFFASLNHCGAAILSEEWVVTAAHCVTSLKKYGQKSIWVGGVTLRGSKRVPYDRVVVHPKAREHRETTAPLNDIALIHLAKPLRFSDKVRAVTLPTDDVETKRNLVFAGRGRDESGSISERLKKMEVARLTTQECVSNLPVDLVSRIKPDLKYLEKIYVCAKRQNNRPGLCFGDSGSPLVHNNTLVGVASFFLGNACQEGRLGFYTNVATYVSWIKSVTGLK